MRSVSRSELPELHEQAKRRAGEKIRIRLIRLKGANESIGDFRTEMNRRTEIHDPVQGGVPDEYGSIIRRSRSHHGRGGKVEEFLGKENVLGVSTAIGEIANRARRGPERVAQEAVSRRPEHQVMIENDSALTTDQESVVRANRGVIRTERNGPPELVRVAN